MRIKREAEEAAKARQDAAKREKENAKRALKRERKQLQNYGKQFNYFSSSEAEHVARMADLDRLCELLTIDEYEPKDLKLISITPRLVSISLFLLLLLFFFSPSQIGEAQQKDGTIS